MTPAYDEAYIDSAQRVLAGMLDEATYGYGLDPEDFFDGFLRTDLCRRFERGDVRIIAGMSGAELAGAVFEQLDEDGRFRNDKTQPDIAYPRGYSREWWAGWSLAYYQWLRALGFADIIDAVPLGPIVSMYDPYHEMDVSAFVARMDELWRQRHPTTRLAELRQMARLSQSQLARASGVPVRSIQQYEQRAKDINGCHATTLVSLARALRCTPEALIEHVPW